MAQPGQVSSRSSRALSVATSRIVRGLVEEHEVLPPRGAPSRERDTSPLASGQRRHLLTLLVPVEEEALEVHAEVDLLGAEVDLTAARRERALVPRDVVVHGPVVLEARARLIEEGDLGIGADLHRTAIGHELPREEAQEGRLADAIPPDDADAIARDEVQGQVRDELPATERYADALEVQDALAEPRHVPVDPGEIDGLHVLAGFVGDGRLGPLDARLLLRGPRLRPAAEPLGPRGGGSSGGSSRRAPRAPRARPSARRNPCSFHRIRSRSRDRARRCDRTRRRARSDRASP
jgi:hypothetical protein